jgi:hypothetical protein
VAVDEDSPVFNLAVYPFVGGAPVSLVRDVGMFAYPKTSPWRETSRGDRNFLVAFLRALNPRQSRTSNYQLMVMDRDGSNMKLVFPIEIGQGLTPNDYYWLPWYAAGDYPFYIALIYQGDLCLVDVDTGEIQQLTEGGLVTAMDWK